MRRFGKAVAAGLGVLVLGSCAVTEIDVDVYKGPLANHRAVQIQQYAAMAIGAKPLLIQLRDLLEWGDEYEEELSGPDRPKWYKARFVPPAPGGVSHFEKVQAQRVNAILSLYEDSSRTGVTDFIERGGAALAKLRSLEPIALGDAERDREDWQSIAPHFVKPVENKRLINDWTLFICPGKNPAKAPGYRPMGCMNFALEHRSAEPEEGCHPERNWDWREELKDFRDPDNIRKHAYVLFLEKGTYDPQVD